MLLWCVSRVNSEIHGINFVFIKLTLYVDLVQLTAISFVLHSSKDHH